MIICYVDEFGTADALRHTDPNSTPVFVLAGISIPMEHLSSLTWDFLSIKKTFNPHLQHVRLSELIQFEMKGSTLRRDLRKDGRNNQRRAFRILDQVLDCLDRHHCKIMGKVIVKVPDAESAGDPATYTRAIADMAATFNAQLQEHQRNGLMILDARTKVKNAPKTLSLTTRRFRAGGGDLNRLLESPVFGHSDSHVILQIADLLASAVLFPIACVEYAHDLTWNAHPHANYRNIKNRFGSSLQKLEYRYTAPDGRTVGGFQVTDRRFHRPTHWLFRNDSTTPDDPRRQEDSVTRSLRQMTFEAAQNGTYFDTPTDHRTR